MTKKLPTIKEIAKRLNVSVSTVSRALHDHPSIGLRTRMQVQQVAKEINYEPNQAAIFFKQGKTFTLGVILPNLQEQFFSIAINGIEKKAIEHNYNVLISQSHDDPKREKQIVETMRRNRVDGIIVSVSKNSGDYKHFQELEQFNIPVVFFDRAPEMPGAISVTCRLKESTVAMVDFFVKKGIKRIGFINGPGAISLTQERAEGYKEALLKNKLKEEKELIVQTDLTSGGTEKAIGKLLALKKLPTAVIAFNDYVALDAIRYARKEGLQINKDIFFGSYANLPIIHYLNDPPIVSVEQFPFEQAEKATDILLQLINKKDNSSANLPQKIVLEGELVLHEE
ncbi:MAG TPA: LacI family DNA-binding transcriptional regulator [Chitinophagaceae bacterium]